MSEAIKDGGPAFPQTMEYHPELGECGRYVFAGEYGQGGMSLRDYFAVAAMQSVINAPGACNLLNGLPEYTLQENSAVAAYKFADAMLKAREQ